MTDKRKSQKSKRTCRRPSAIERLTIVNDCYLLDGKSFENFCMDFSMAFALNQINETNQRNDEFGRYQVSFNLYFARFELVPK